MHSPPSPPAVLRPSTRRRCSRLSHRERRFAFDYSSRTPHYGRLSHLTHQHGAALRTGGVGASQRVLGTAGVIELRHLANVAAVATKVGHQVCRGQPGAALRTGGVGSTRRMLGVIELRHLAPVAAVAVKVGRQVCGGQPGAALRTGGAGGAGLSQRGAAGVVELAAITAAHPKVSDGHAGAIE